MEQIPLNPVPTVAPATWEIIRPTYSFGLISHEARWWYFEGHFWGGFEEQEKAEQREAALRQEIESLSETVAAYELTLRGLRWELTWKGTDRKAPDKALGGFYERF